jgi:hypothetical protein
MPLTEGEVYRLACESRGLKDQEALIRTIYDREAQFYTTMSQGLVGAAIAGVAAFTGVAAARQANLIDEAQLGVAGACLVVVAIGCAVAACVFAKRALDHPARLYSAIQSYNAYVEICSKLDAGSGTLS